MEPTPYFTNDHDSGSEFWYSTDSEDEKSSSSSGVVEVVKETPSWMQETEYFTTEIVGNSSYELFPDEYYSFRCFISGRFFLDKRSCCYRSFANEKIVFALNTLGDQEV